MSSSSSSMNATAKKKRPAVSSKTTQAPAPAPAPAPTAHTTAVTVTGGAGGEKDMEQFVKGILDEMQTRFSEMSSQIVDKIDSFSERISDLEGQIESLMKDSGAAVGSDAAGGGGAATGAHALLAPEGAGQSKS